MTDFAQQVAVLQPYLLKYARLQLRNEAWAEDVVSDVVLAALSKPQSFAQRAQLKTWLVGILKHKVVDALRLHQREVSLTASGEDEAADPLDHIAFGQDGHFVEAPADWGNPEQEIRQRQFFDILEACTRHLPANQARLFLMREWLEMDSDEICKALDMTTTNLYVQLHRARGRLRECLALNWYGRTGGE